MSTTSEKPSIEINIPARRVGSDLEVGLPEDQVFFEIKPKPPTPLDVAHSLVRHAFDGAPHHEMATLLAEARAWFELSLRMGGA